MAKLANNETSGFTDVVRLTAADLKTIGNGGTKKIFTVPAGGAVELIGGVITTSIAGGTAAPSIGVGVSGAATELLSAFAPTTAPAAPVFNTGSLFTSGATKAIKAVSSDTDIILTLTDANISGITAGEILIGIRILDLARFVNV
jgi:hypothetical protein